MLKRKYSTGYVDYPGVGRITDEMIAKYVRKHTHWWDRLDYHKVSDACVEWSLAEWHMAAVDYIA